MPRRRCERAVDGDGTAYVVDERSASIQRCVFSPSFSCTRYGSRGRKAGQFTLPEGIALDGTGAAYVADSFNHRIQRCVFSPEFSCTIVFSKKGPPTDAQVQLQKPVGIGLMDDVAMIVDKYYHRVQLARLPAP